MEDIKRLQQKINDEISTISKHRVGELTKLWEELFEPEICKDHMRKLTQHVEAFFSDISRETEERKIAIVENIEKLQAEKNELKRLLKEDVNLVTNSDMPLHSLLVSMDESLRCLREKLKTRTDLIVRLLAEQDHLCNEMNEKRRKLASDPLPSADEVTQFQNHLVALHEEKRRRNEEIVSIRACIQEILGFLEIALLDEYDHALVNDVDMKPTMDNIAKLKHLFNQFEKQFEDMKNQIEVMKKKIESLWKYLTISESHQQKFQRYTSITQSTFDIFYKELEKCQQIKQENMKKIIKKIREEIQEWWDKCLKSEQERQRFPSFKDSVYNEDSLNLHEMELDELKAYYEEHVKIFETYEKRTKMWQEKNEMDNRPADPKRYNNRGGKLLEEEKQRKRIEIQLPQIEFKLLEMLGAYEEKFKRPFTVFGESLAELIELEHENKRQEKLLKSGRKANATQLALTPGRTPLAGQTTLRTPRLVATASKGSILRPRLAAASCSKLLSATSSTTSCASSIATTNGKRKLIPQNLPQAKRTLFNSPSGVLKSSNILNRQPVSTVKLTAHKSLKLSNYGQSVKRLSHSRRSKDRRNRSSGHRNFRKMKVPDVVIINSSTDQSILSGTMSYDKFEDHIGENESARSSILPKSHKAQFVMNRVPHSGFCSPIMKKQTPKKHTPRNPALMTPSTRLRLETRDQYLM